MKKPSSINFFFAHAIAIAAGVGASILTLAVSWRVGPALWVAPVYSAGAIIVACPLGAVLGFFLLGYPLNLLGKMFNGGPFREGDWVQILVGPYRGRIGRVYSVWATRDAIRVDLGPQAKVRCKDVFSVLEVCRQASNPGD